MTTAKPTEYRQLRRDLDQYVDQDPTPRTNTTTTEGTPMTNHRTTTSYGTWGNYKFLSPNRSAYIEDSLSRADTEWIDRMREAGAIDAIESDYVTAIRDALPAGVILSGDEFIGPYPYTDEAGEAIERALDSADNELAAIFDRHDVDRTDTATHWDIEILIHLPGDRVDAPVFRLADKAEPWTTADTEMDPHDLVREIYTEGQQGDPDEAMPHGWTAEWVPFDPEFVSGIE